MAMLTPELAFQLALGHRQAGRLPDAEALLRQIVAVQPNHTSAWHQLGLVVLQLGRPAEAVDLIRQAVALQPGNAALHSDLGVAYRMRGDLEEAITSFRNALRLHPGAGHTHRNLGDALLAAGQSEEAIASYRSAIAAQPTDAGAHNNLGNVYLHLGQLEDAAACYQRAVDLEPRLIQAQSNLGDMLTKLDRPEEGLVCAQRVLALDPNFAEGHLNMGVAYWRMGHFAEAETCYRRAIALNPNFVDAHLNLGLLLLLHGRYEEGWREYEWHWRSGTHASRRRDLAAPTWDGTPAEGKTILTYCDQGFGDTLQFVRYLPLVLEQSRAARLIVECQAALIPLLRQLGGPQIEFIPREDSKETSPPHDLHVSFFDFPLVLRRFEPLTTAEPYLKADEEKRAAWRSRLGPSGKKRVGIAWAGNPAQRDDRRRSMKPEMLRPILTIPDITFVNLQFQPPGPLPAPIAEAGVLDVREHIADFADSAALLAELDLIITVDTSVAHLAGALGRPAWVMVSFVPDFRWGIAHTDTPWYPSMRLFRQPRPGDWETVVQDVQAALRR
ncbi:TPR repeat-containing protein [Chthoniobacter flavus Ellin428]|uniref:TPR repeat-containing protein n=2 Tax=Chthoniobacter flavus TaxID=191863 RepID=B4CWG5_9BACT|nr:TPR repeat-containing protein [Chthoniobacter flavus Ellin428]